MTTITKTAIVKFLANFVTHAISFAGRSENTQVEIESITWTLANFIFVLSARASFQAISGRTTGNFVIAP